MGRLDNNRFRLGEKEMDFLGQLGLTPFCSSFVPIFFESRLRENLLPLDKRDISLLVTPLLHVLDYPSDSLDDEPLLETTSEIFTSSLCKEAHTIMPIDITVGMSEKNQFSPDWKILTVGFTPFYSTLIFERGDSKISMFDFIEGLDRLSSTSKFLAQKVLSEDYVRATVAHEISHWLRYALQRVRLGKEDDPLMSHIEVDAYVHGVRARYELVGKDVWDSMTTEEKLETDIPIVFALLKQPKMKPLLLKRLHREGLI